MIVALINQHRSEDRCVIARNLAVLRARSGRKVCLVTPAPHGSHWCFERNSAGIAPRIETRGAGKPGDGVELLRRHFNDVVADVGCRHTQASQHMLAAAKRVLVPVHGGDLDLASQYDLIERMHAAHRSNPDMRVLFVMVTAVDGPAATERAAVRACVARLRGAGLAATVLCAPAALDYGAGRCVCDAETCDPEAARQMHDLYREIYAPDTAPATAPMPLALFPPRAFVAL